MKNTKIEGITGLKGIAALAIVAFHVWAILGFSGSSYILDKVVGNFDSLVRLFFILSSFGIFYGYGRKWEEGNFDFKIFLSKRFVKIAPAFYVVAFVHLILRIMQGQGEIKFSVISTALLIFGMLPYGQENLVWGGWSVGIEWIFYLLFPVFAVLIERKKVFYTVGILSIIEILLYDAIMQANGIANSHINFIRYIPYFMAGIMIHNNIDSIRKGKRIIYPIIICVLIIALLLWEKNRDIAMLMSFSAILIWIILKNGIIFNNRVVKFLGKISYEIYLFHLLLIRIFSQYGFANKFFHLNVSRNCMFLCLYLVILIFTIICAFVLNRSILKIRRKLNIV